MYLDPGFGGMLVQVLVAIVAAGGAIVFSMRKKLKSMFSKDKPNAHPANKSPTSAADDAIDMLDNDAK